MPFYCFKKKVGNIYFLNILTLTAQHVNLWYDFEEKNTNFFREEINGKKRG